MKILLIAENVFGLRDANGNCIWNIAKELHRRGNEVHILSTLSGRIEAVPDTVEGIYCHWHPTPWKYPLTNIKQDMAKHSLSSFSFLLKKVYYKLFLFKQEEDTIIKKREIPLWKTSIKKTLNACSFDRVLICFYPIEPVAAYCALEADEIKIPPFWVYQVDAYIDNVLYSKSGRDKRIQLIRQTFGKSDGIFTTPLLEGVLRQVLPQKKDQITALEFPLLTEHPALCSGDIANVSDEICGVFAGTLYREIRWPEYLLKLLAACGQKNLKLLFFVNNQLSPEQITEWKKSNPEIAVEFHSGIPFDEMIQVLQKADFLINIGNKTANQLPSKIIDYISIGRPILNLIQIENCPSIHYLEKYPMRLNLRTWDDFDKSVEQCRAFIRSAAVAQTMPFYRTQELFQELTPRFVTDNILKGLQGPERDNA